MKKQRPTNAQNVMCNKCGASGHAPPGSKHRRCGGSKGAAVREKHNNAAEADRGTWE
jgi:hypothetical protein